MSGLIVSMKSHQINRYHLQALRHLYVLAAEPRILVTRDVRTGQACSVDMIVRCDDDRREGASTQTPCVVPEWSTIREVKDKDIYKLRSLIAGLLASCKRFGD